MPANRYEPFDLLTTVKRSVHWNNHVSRNEATSFLKHRSVSEVSCVSKYDNTLRRIQKSHPTGVRVHRCRPMAEMHPKGGYDGEEKQE